MESSSVVQCLHILLMNLMLHNELCVKASDDDKSSGQIADAASPSKTMMGITCRRRSDKELKEKRRRRSGCRADCGGVGGGQEKRAGCVAEVKG